MINAETRLAIVNAEAAAAGRVLVAGFGSPDLAEALRSAGADEVVAFEQDIRRYRAAARDGSPAVFGPWFGPGAPALESADARAAHDAFTGAWLVLPKETERLQMMLAMIAPMMGEQAPVVVVGHNDAGIRSAGRHLDEVFVSHEVLDFRYHARALLCRAPGGAPPFDIGAWRGSRAEAIAGRTLIVTSYPGVFSHRETDPATAMLLGAIRIPEDARVLDVGCGSGIIAAWCAATPGAKVHAIDVDALALLATWQTARASGVGDRVGIWASDVFGDVTESYTHIVSNPPFHAGVRTTAEMARRLIADAPRHLEPRGELWLVANRFLDYATPLRATFRRVDVAAEDNRFRVWRARR